MGATGGHGRCAATSALRSWTEWWCCERSAVSFLPDSFEPHDRSGSDVPSCPEAQVRWGVVGERQPCVGRHDPLAAGPAEAVPDLGLDPTLARHGSDLRARRHARRGVSPSRVRPPCAALVVARVRTRDLRPRRRACAGVRPFGLPGAPRGAGEGAVALGLLAVPSFALAVRRARDAGLPRVIAAPFALVPIVKAAAYAAAAGAVLLPAVLGTTAGWTWRFWNVPVGVAGGVRGYPGGFEASRLLAGCALPICYWLRRCPGGRIAGLHSRAVSI